MGAELIAFHYPISGTSSIGFLTADFHIKKCLAVQLEVKQALYAWIEQNIFVGSLPLFPKKKISHKTKNFQKVWKSNLCLRHSRSLLSVGEMVETEV